MRSFIVALVPALALSLSVIACSADTNEPDTTTNQSDLVAEGGNCDENACEEGLVCQLPVLSTHLGIRGLPAPTPAPAPTTTTDPTPAPAPAPTTTTQPVPQPAPAAHKVCLPSSK